MLGPYYCHQIKIKRSITFKMNLKRENILNNDYTMLVQYLSFHSGERTDGPYISEVQTILPAMYSVRGKLLCISSVK